jgi:hypothetical protein
MIVPCAFNKYLILFETNQRNDFPFLEVVGYLRLGLDFAQSAGGGSKSYVMLDQLYFN